jgi:hypothetical protein
LTQGILQDLLKQKKFIHANKNINQMNTKSLSVLEFYSINERNKKLLNEYIEFPSFDIWNKIHNIKILHLTLAEYIAIVHPSFSYVYTHFKNTGHWNNKPSKYIVKEVLRNLFYFLLNEDYCMYKDIEHMLFLNKQIFSLN